jgi:hypothetical protein
MDRIEEMIQNLELLRMHFGDITKTCMANGIIDSTIKAIEKLATYENAEKHGLPERYEADEKDTPAEKPQTNADRIRSMTDEELAEMLSTVSQHCVVYLSDKINCRHSNCDTGCKNNIKKWLQKEMEKKDGR